MITLKEYAEKHGISYEAVRKQVKRYREELGDHLQIKGRTQYLDEAGAAFLDSKRAGSPIIIMEQSKDELIEELKADNAALKDQVLRLQELIIRRDDRLMELQEQLLLLTARADPSQEAAPEAPERPTEEPEAAPAEIVEEPAQPATQPGCEPQSRPEKAEEPPAKRKWWQFWK